jgi:hypothetical protein
VVGDQGRGVAARHPLSRSSRHPTIAACRRHCQLGCHTATRLPFGSVTPAESIDTLQVLDLLGHVRAAGNVRP